MAAVSVTPDLYEKADFTDIYLTLHVAVVVPDAQAREFKTLESIAALKGKRIAVEKGSYYARVLRAAAPNFTIVELDDPMDFFTEPGVADALYTSAEEGSAYTLMYPQVQGGRARDAVHAGVPRLPGGQGTARVGGRSSTTGSPSRRTRAWAGPSTTTGSPARRPWRRSRAGAWCATCCDWVRVRDGRRGAGPHPAARSLSAP